MFDKCSICGETKKLVKHHIDQNRNNNSVENIMLLCKNCHAKQPRKRFNDFKILTFIKDKEIIYPSQVANHFGITVKTACKLLEKVEESTLIERFGNNPKLYQVNKKCSNG